VIRKILIYYAKSTGAGNNSFCVCALCLVIASDALFVMLLFFKAILVMTTLILYWFILHNSE
jgi:hypothetical protein